MDVPIIRWLSDLRTVGAFLTILPFRPAVGAAEDGYERGNLSVAAWGFPIIGLLLGATGGLCYAFAIWLGCTVWLAAVLSLAVLVLLCGGIHEDGLGDFADGFGGANCDRRLAIMHDSQAGNFAILALLLLSAGRIGALAALDALERVFLALLVAASLSRAAVVVVMHILPPARSDGLSAGAGQPTLNITFAAILIAAAIAVLTLGFVAALACMAAAAVAAALVAVTARRRLGGQTGDVLGAVQNITEFSCLFAAGLAFLWLLGGGYLF